MRTFTTLPAAMVAAGLLSISGCGGGLPTDTDEERAQESIERANRVSTGFASPAKKKALSAALLASAPAPTVTAEQMLDWIERAFPETFPPGPKSVSLAYEGTNYVAVRAYVSGNYVGITAGGEVRGLGPFTANILRSFGNLTDFTCQVLPQVCTVPGAGPGHLAINRDSGAVFSANLDSEGRLQWLGVAMAGDLPLPKPTEVLSVEWRSNRRGWGDGNQTANPPSADGAYLAPKNMCNRDRGLPTMTTLSGVWWPDFSAEGWKLNGDLGPRVVFGQIEYGQYEPATISVIREADNTVTLVMDFASDCLFGFGKDGQLVGLDRSKLYEFGFHSNKAGQGRGPGWGSGPTASSPTTRRAYPSYDELGKRFLVKFQGMSCTDAGSVTVASGTEAGAGVVNYDYGADGYGAGWLVIPSADDGNPIWQPGSGVSFDPVNYRVVWDKPLCTEK